MTTSLGMLMTRWGEGGREKVHFGPQAEGVFITFTSFLDPSEPHLGQNASATTMKGASSFFLKQRLIFMKLLQMATPTRQALSHVCSTHNLLCSGITAWCSSITLCGRESLSGVITTAERNISSGSPCLDHRYADHCAQCIPRHKHPAVHPSFQWEGAKILLANGNKVYSILWILADISIPSQKTF